MTQRAFIDSAGTISTFDVPGAFSTVPVGINDPGEITGEYIFGIPGQPDSFDEEGSSTPSPATSRAR